jgi:hypothetical protein
MCVCTRVRLSPSAAARPVARTLTFSCSFLLLILAVRTAYPWAASHFFTSLTCVPLFELSCAACSPNGLRRTFLRIVMFFCTVISQLRTGTSSTRLKTPVQPPPQLHPTHAERHDVGPTDTRLFLLPCTLQCTLATGTREQLNLAASSIASISSPSILPHALSAFLFSSPSLATTPLQPRTGGS